jgi:precorrin-2 dehydrogenase / sirohydrochlorin ferrochelatase
MIPIVVDPARVAVALVGTGPAAVRRLAWLTDGGAIPAVYAPAPDAALAVQAGERFVARLPSAEEVAALSLLFVAGLSVEVAEPLAAAARAAGVIVNVEDVNDLCSAHLPAVVRRGDLLLTVSTGGGSPGLAKAIRQRLEDLFPACWAGRLKELASLRTRARADGAEGAEVSRAIAAHIAREGWL